MSTIVPATPDTQYGEPVKRCPKCDTVEVWRPVRDYEHLYEISTLGEARSTPRRRRVGYGRTRMVPSKVLTKRRVSLRDEPRSTRNVLRAVLFLEHFSRAPLGAVDTFRDGDSTHLCVGNLDWEFPDICYRAMHRKVERHFGKAGEHACMDCGGPASEWSYSHSGYCEVVSENGLPYSLDPAEYGPRCLPCHRRYDGSERRRDPRGRWKGVA